MTYERITDDPVFDGEVRNSHELRYYIARGFVEEGDTALDAACGTGYGKDILKCNYIGLDKIDGFDLEEDDFDGEFDLFVSFETIEHLEKIDKFVSLAKRAKKWIIISTPIIPTAKWNIYHKRDFTPEQIIDLFSSDGFTLYGWLKQKEKYGIFIFKK